MKTYEWLEKRTIRSVDNLKLWGENPRIDPEEKHRTIKDYATDLIKDNSEKDSFIKLIDSIVNNGFIPADPIVIWKDGEKFYVAEGNRRILALKLLRSPEKAPKSIRSKIRTQANQIDRNLLEKVKVALAPSFEDLEWYINQRHFSNSLQRPWSRLQQQRWIAELYDKYDKNIEKVCDITSLSVSDISSVLRILKIRDLALDPIVMNILNPSEREDVQSHRIPMTILERFFINSVVKEKWGLDFEDDELVIKSNRSSFLNAYAYFIKLVIQRDIPGVKPRINTRTITDNLEEILNHLPDVNFGDNDNEDKEKNEGKDDIGSDTTDSNDDETETPAPPEKPMSEDPNRNKIIPSNHKLNTGNYKLAALFKELQKLPFNVYRNITAASLRVFLDLAVLEFIKGEGLEPELKRIYNGNFLQDIPLKKRLEYLKAHNLTSRTKEYKVVEKLLNPSNEHSLDTLNNFIHGTEIHKTEKTFLNGFWSFLFPLFKKLLSMEEK